MKLVVPMLLVLTLAACGPTPRGADSGAAERPTGATQSNRTLSMIMRVEPPDILAGAVDRSAIHKPLFTAALDDICNADPMPTDKSILRTEIPILTRQGRTPGFDINSDTF